MVAATPRRDQWPRIATVTVTVTVDGHWHGRQMPPGHYDDELSSSTGTDHDHDDDSEGDFVGTVAWVVGPVPLEEPIWRRQCRSERMARVL